MTEIPNAGSTERGERKEYDLEERTFQFAKNVALCCRKLPPSVSNAEHTRQAVKASASAGADYREANEPLSKRDFRLRNKISRKEAKESGYWLRLIVDTNPPVFEEEGMALRREAIELKKIFPSLVDRSV